MLLCGADVFLFFSLSLSPAVSFLLKNKYDLCLHIMLYIIACMEMYVKQAMYTIY